MAGKKKIVIKLGGSFLFDKGPNIKYIRDLADLMKRLYKNYSITVIVGAGSTARNYILAARELGANESYYDLIGIDTSRLNARLFISALGDMAYKEPCRNFEDIVIAESSGKIVVIGGLVPGQTTDAVAAEVAEYIGADKLVIAKDVDYIYSEDPKKNPDARKNEKMTREELVELVSKSRMRAKDYSVIDLVAAQIIYRAKFSAVVVNGSNVKNMENAVIGKKFVGTEII